MIQIKKLKNFVAISNRAEGDAGIDVHSTIFVNIFPGQRVVIPIGISAAVPKDRYLRVAPRSGLAVKKGLDVLAGVIDSSYRGEIGVVLINHGEETVAILRGDKIAQLIPTMIDTSNIEFVDELGETVRGKKGYGSSGVR